MDLIVAGNAAAMHNDGALTRKPYAA